MSHKVEVLMIADQEITVLGKRYNIHDIHTIVVDADGKIIDLYLRIDKDMG